MRRLTTMILAGTWALAVAGPAQATLPAGNVVVNGGAEQGTSSIDYFVTNPPTGWTATPAGITQVRYDAVPAPPRISGGAANTAFFIGGNGTTTRTMTQAVNLAAGAPEFDGGRVYATLSAELGGFDAQPDRVTVSAAFKAAGGATLGTLTLPTVSAGDRGGQTKLLARVDHTLVPAGTRSAEISVVFAFIVSGGHTYNDGVADNLSLSFVDGTEQLVLNPGAELGTASADANPPRFAPPLWTSTVGATQHQYAGAGFPTPADSAAIGGGSAFFAGGSANPLSTMTQEVVFSAARLAAIRTGGAVAALSAHLGGYATDADRTELSLTFWDIRTGDDVVLGTMSLPTVTAADRGNVTKFLRRERTQAIPADTDYAILEVSFIRQAAVDPLAYNDGYLDNVALDVLVAPQTQIVSGPDGAVDDATPAWTFTATPPAGATFSCRIDLAEFAPCVSGDTFGPLADGAHSFEVRASDAVSTDPTPARRDILVDTVAAATAIALTPASGASTTSVGVIVNASDSAPSSGIAEIRCALDPAGVPTSFADLPAGACPSTVTAPGVHTLYAATRDTAGNRSTVVNARIVIESDPPATAITTTPASGIDATSVTARVTAEDAGSGVAELRCALDLATPPASFADLPATCPYATATAITAPGRHTLYAAARDRAGTAGPVVSKTIVISSPPQTTIDSGPAGTTGDPTPTFTFSGGATFSCRIDSGASVGCTSPYTTPPLPDGPHTFSVAATNADGIADPTPATRTFSVDRGATDATPPVSTITLQPSSPPAGETYAGVTGVVVTADDGDGRGVEEIRCVIDPPDVPASFADLPAGCSRFDVTALGAHTIYAAARDAAGNAERPIARSFTLAVRPTTQITGEPPTFSFTSDTPGATFLCEVDAGGRVPCSSPFTAPGLTAGEHTFSVRAIAPNGLVDLLGARRDFTVAAPPANTRPQVQLAGPNRAVLGERVELYAGGGDITAKTSFGWDIDGDQRTDLTCTGLPGIRFTADDPGSTNVGVTASGGLSGAAVQVLSTAGRAAAARVASLQQGAGSLTQLALPNLAECLPPRPGTGDRWEELPACAATQLARPVTQAGSFFIRGCLRRGRTLADVPAPERPAVRAALEDWLRRDRNASTIYEGKPLVLGGTTKKSYSDADYEAASRAMVWYVGEFVEFEGTQFEARTGHKLVLFPQLDRLVTSGADISVGDVALESPGAFSLNLAPKGGRIALGAFKVTQRAIVYGTSTYRRASRVRLAGLRFDGVLRVTIRPGGSELDGFVGLPDTVFAPDTAAIHLEVLRSGDVANGLYQLHFAGTTVGPLDTEFLGIGARNVKLTIAEDLRTLRVSGTLCLGGPVGCLDLDATFKDGTFVEAHAFVNLPDPGLAIAPSVFLNGFGGGFGIDPTRIYGKAKLTVLGIFDINGKLVLAFPSSAARFELKPGDLDGLPAKLYRSYSAATFGASGEAGMKLPFGLGRVSLATAYFLYRAPAYVAFGGRLGFDKYGIRLTGGVDGEFNAENGRFNLFGDINASLFGMVDAGAIAGISSGGAGGCVDIGPVIIGGGVQWRPGIPDFFLWPFDGCKWTRFTADNVVAEPAQAGGARRVVVRRGDPSRAIELRSADGAPAVRVTGPGGVDLTSSDGPGVVYSGKARILRATEIHLTTVGLVDPVPGTYLITPLPGSPAITAVRSAEDPPDARVTAKVEGHGAVRTLRYDVLARPGQRVTFADVGEGATRIIGSVSGGRGAIRFRPVPGRGRRSVVARFELAGMNAERRTVARFTPLPVALPRVSGLKLRRVAAGRVVLRWRSVAGAERYRVVAALGDGRRVRVMTRGRSAVVSAPGLAYGAVVRVLPLATGREGRVAVVRLKTTSIAPPARFGTLRGPARSSAGLAD